MKTENDRPPVGLAADGRRLWRSVLADFALDEHEKLLLLQACRTADIVAALDASVRGSGDLLTVAGRVRPELVELRQQRIVLTRILAALRVPLGAETETPGHGPARLQRRSGARGVYRMGGSA